MVRSATFLMLLSVAPASAEEPEAPPEITVWGEHAAREARLEVVEALEAEGYRFDRSRNGKDVFVSPQAWKPKVVLDRDGYVVTRRRNVVWVGADGRADEQTFEPEDVICVVWPPACVSTRGAQVSQKKFNGKTNSVLTAIAPQMEAYRQVLQDEGHLDRMERLLPRQLDQLWFEGVGPDGTVYAEPLARRAAIVDLWLTRVDDVWGDEAREVIEHFLADHVQDSEFALSEAEIAAVDARYEGIRRFSFSDPAPPPEVVAVEAAPAPPEPPPAPPEAASTLMRSSLFDIAPLGAPTRRQPLEWLRGTEQDAIEAEAVSPNPEPVAAPGLAD